MYIDQGQAMAHMGDPILSEIEIDAIGEVLNISMGAAATAVSSMLDKRVVITTPKVAIQSIDHINYRSLEPAMIVKITYISGITGSNVMVFRQSDMQMILNQLMGIDEPPRDDFVFDELSMSAAGEVMNQMMGASATALSEFLGKSINISTPTTSILDGEHSFKQAVELEDEDSIITIVFDLSIGDSMQSEFMCVMSIELAKMIVSQFMSDKQMSDTTTPSAAAPNQPGPIPQPQATGQPQATAQLPNDLQWEQQQPYPGQPMPQMPPIPPMQDMNGQPIYQQPGMPPYGYPPYGAPAYPPMPGYPYGYPPQQQMPPYGYQAAPNGVAGQPDIIKNPVNVKQVQYPDFSNQSPPPGAAPSGGNMDLILNVPLSVSVEIGKTKKKIKDIMEFTQGTVLELEKQAGAPVDIVVNGQLIARGDVVVIDDCFGVRVTEIMGTKELIKSIGSN